MEAMQGLICVWVAVVLVSALFGAALGEDRGRGGHVGALFGMVFGPLGVVMLLMLGRSPKAEAAYLRNVDTERTRLAEEEMLRSESQRKTARVDRDEAAVVASVSRKPTPLDAELAEARRHREELENKLKSIATTKR